MGHLIAKKHFMFVELALKLALDLWQLSQFIMLFSKTGTFALAVLLFKMAKLCRAGRPLLSTRLRMAHLFMHPLTFVMTERVFRDRRLLDRTSRTIINRIRSRRLFELLARRPCSAANRLFSPRRQHHHLSARLTFSSVAQTQQGQQIQKYAVTTHPWRQSGPLRLDLCLFISDLLTIDQRPPRPIRESIE